MSNPAFDIGEVSLAGMADYVDLSVRELTEHLNGIDPLMQILDTAGTYEEVMDVWGQAPAGHVVENVALWRALELANTAEEVWGVLDQARSGGVIEVAALLKLARFFPKG